MKNFLILILFLSFCIPQKNNKRNNNKKNKMKQTMFSTMNEEAKMTFYQSQKLSPERASIYQLALPIIKDFAKISIWTKFHGNKLVN